MNEWCECVYVCVCKDLEWGGVHVLSSYSISVFTPRDREIAKYLSQYSRCPGRGQTGPFQNTNRDWQR